MGRTEASASRVLLLLLSRPGPRPEMDVEWSRRFMFVGREMYCNRDLIYSTGLTSYYHSMVILMLQYN